MSNVLYSPPKGLAERLEKFLNYIFNNTNKSTKFFHITSDFNLNVLDHDNCKKVLIFLNLLNQNNIIPIINKAARVTRKTATATDHIIKNCFNDTILKLQFFKSDISNYFLIRSFCHQWLKTIEIFNQKLYEMDWSDVKVCESSSDSSKIFSTKFLCIYDGFFPKKKKDKKNNDIKSPLITTSIKKFSKRKQRLHDKFLKTRNEKKNEDEHKNYKLLFETIKKLSKNFSLFHFNSQ